MVFLENMVYNGFGDPLENEGSAPYYERFVSFRKRMGMSPLSFGQILSESGTTLALARFSKEPDHSSNSSINPRISLYFSRYLKP